MNERYSLKTVRATRKPKFSIMKTISLSFIVFVILFVGCISESIDEAHLKYRGNCEVNELPSLGLSPNDMVAIGILHNEYALRVQSEIRLNSKTEFAEIVNGLTDLYNSELDRLQITDFPQSYEYVIERSMDVNRQLTNLGYDLREWNNCMLSTAGFNEFDKIFETLDNAIDVQDINGKIDVLVVQFSSSNLTQYEKEILITSAEVARNSFELWAPQSIGGLNFYNDIHKGVQLRWSWRNAARGDVAGLATYFNGLAVSGAINAAWIPGANGAIAAGAAAAAVGGSIWGGIF